MYLVHMVRRNALFVHRRPNAQRTLGVDSWLSLRLEITDTFMDLELRTVLEAPASKSAHTPANCFWRTRWTVMKTRTVFVPGSVR